MHWKRNNKYNVKEQNLYVIEIFQRITDRNLLKKDNIPKIHDAARFRKISDTLKINYLIIILLWKKFMSCIRRWIYKRSETSEYIK